MQMPCRNTTVTAVRIALFMSVLSVWIVRGVRRKRLARKQNQRGS